MLRAFLQWWGRQLTSVLFGADSAVTPSGVIDGMLIAIPHAQSMTLLRHRRGRETTLGDFPLDVGGAEQLRRRMGRGGATLRLDAGMALERDVTLPLAARDNLVDVLRMDMDRLSPFAAADVYWSHRIVAEDVIRGRLVVRLSMVPRRAIAHAIQVLTQLGLRPVAIAAPMADGTWHHIGVDAPAEAHRPYRRRALGFACVLWALLGIAAAITPFLRQELRLREVEAQIARLRPSVSEAEALRREIATARAGEDALAQVRTGTASPLAVIAALTSALPDDSFLTALSSRGGTIELQGQSRNAARLIGLLSEEPGIRGVAFAAPVTRIDGEARELFTIRATVTP